MGRILLIAVRNILVNRRRSLLLGGAVAVVTLLLVMLGAVGNGMKETMLTAGTTLESGHVNVGGFYKITSGHAAPVIMGLKKLREDVAATVPEATRLMDRMRGFGKLVSEQDSVMSGVTGLDIVNEPGIREFLHIVAGNIDDLGQERSILLFADQAERLNVGVGDAITLSAPVLKGTNNAIDLTVVAVAKEMGFLSMFNCFVPNQTLRDLYGLSDDTTGAVLVYLPDPGRAPEVEARLRSRMQELGWGMMEKQAGPFWGKFQLVSGEDWTGQRLDLTTWTEELQMMDWWVQTFDLLTMVLVGILLLIIMAGVMNTVWISVRDRTREVGTLRAIGMGRFRVLVMFMLEAFLLALGATAAGMAVASGLVAFINSLRIEVSPAFQMVVMSDVLRLVTEPRSLAGALVLIPLLTTLGALIPSLRAARMRPNTAIQHVA